MIQNIKAKTTLILLLFFCCTIGFSQDTLVVNKAEAETIFLQNNLTLLAKKLSISKAEAQLIQAKVWPNPTLTIDQVNLWKPKSKIQGQELVPPLSGDFGRNQQFGISIEQLIITAGKRKKLMELEKVSIAQSKQYFEEVLRNLKVELRIQLNQLHYLQSYKTVYEQQLSSINQLTQAYKNQVEAGFLNKGEYYRLKALALEILSDIHELENEYSSVEYQLKQLMHLPTTVHFQLNEEGLKVDRATLIDLDTTALIDTAQNNRPDFEISKLQENYAQQQLKVEKAERIPDLSLIGEYNRGDAIYTDFIGFGIALDLPVFNRNQGNIRIANLAIEQAELQQKLLMAEIAKEVHLALYQFRKALEFSQEIEEDYENELDQMLTAYTQNFQNKNIDLIQYLDFLEAYLENKNIILQAAAELREKAEELNYVVGKDIIK